MTIRISIFLILAGLCACASPPPDPVVPAKLAIRVEDRAADAELLREALALIEPEPELVAIDELKLDDPDGSDFWLACALAWEPGIRQARRDLLAALARYDYAGLPGPIGVGAGTRELDDLDQDAETALTIDLLGVLGIGPVAAAEALADAEVRRARAALEEAVWRARYAVAEARLGVAISTARAGELRLHEAEAREIMKRVEALSRLGRLPAAAISRARANVLNLARLASAAEIELEADRAALARVCGLPAEHPMLDRISPRTLDEIAARLVAPAAIEPAELVARQPALRTLRLEFALREAALRRAVVATWPNVRIGPRAKINPSDVLMGGVLEVSLPFPGSLQGEIDAAYQARERARERIEERLVEALAALRAARNSERIATTAVADEAGPARDEAITTWRGMSARFRVEEGVWDLWTDALMLRLNTINGYWAAREARLLASIALARESFTIEEGNDD